MTRPSFEEERRGLDRRVGLPDDRPPADRIERRVAFLDRRRREDRRSGPANRGEPSRDEHRRLVLYIAADPVRIDWLRRHVASRLERTAAHLHAQGHVAAADEVRRLAARHRSGEGSLW